MVLLAGPQPALAQGGDEFTLTILHTNDVHANYEKTLARQTTLIKQIREETPNVLLLDAGDRFQGTLFYRLYKGEMAQWAMNYQGYQAMAVGNHEFDDGPPTLAKFIKGANFPVLSANLDVSQDPDLAGLVKPYTVVEVGGEKIGIIGLTTEDVDILSSPGPNVKILPAVDSLKKAVQELTDQGVNKIIALTHVGYEMDKKLAAQVDGVDVIVGGHSHTCLGDVKHAAGPYPTVVNAPSGQPVLVVQACSKLKYMGRLNVTFDDKGVPKAFSGELIKVKDENVPEDPEVAAEVAKRMEPINELKSKIIGETKVDLVGDREVCRFAECNMGNLVTDAIIWKMKDQNIQIALQNAGGIRASIPKGPISLGQVMEVLPFGNTISTFGLKGEDLWAALENGVSRAENPENEGTGRFLQVSGLRYTWDPTRPVGSRIVSVEVKNPDGTYSPLDLNAVYRVAANDFMRKGGDDYKVLAEKAIDPYDYGPPLDEAVADYIHAHSPIAPKVEGRIQKVTSTMPTTGGVPVDWPVALMGLGLALSASGLYWRRRDEQ
ncbi:MAG: multifunctional 2',3'-cyclic-nucleotide 2'-phosphodiesterase/5'-nucleotidase/3'-nucleotidase [Chloroflexi bacterium]|nr:multifunctional 2',3'-cyclic-nucleotide 2'-phosphodiesterase/5'-nucleotidase/3'-nucleotidase [Chloroflexota bacterium]